LQGSQISGKADIRSNNIVVSQISETSWGGAESVSEANPEVNLENSPPLTFESLHQQQTDPKDEGSKVDRFLERMESESTGSYKTPLRVDITGKDAFRLADVALGQGLAHERMLAEEVRAPTIADDEKKDPNEAAKAEEDVEGAELSAEVEAAFAAGEDEAEKKSPPEKRKPIRFKDCIGRKFTFPFELCATWKVGILPFRRYLIDILEWN
jgi:hypothetical protein